MNEEKNEAHTQYDDFTGTISIDLHSGGNPYEIFEIDINKYYLISFSFYLETGFSCGTFVHLSGYIIDLSKLHNYQGETWDKINQYLDAENGNIEVIRIDKSIELNKFINIYVKSVKRTNIHLAPESFTNKIKLFRIVKEIDLDDGDGL